MKQKIYILGLVNTMIIVLGTIFKMNHYPGAAILLTLGVATLVLLFLPIALRNHCLTEGNMKNKALYVVTWLTCFVIFTGMLFKILHWPGAGYLLIIALPFPYVVFLPVFLAVTSKIKNFNIYNTVFVLFLLAAISVFSALLALNVSRDRINDSLELARDYNSLEMVLDEIQTPVPHNQVVQKIDDVLKIIDEYQTLILGHESLTEKQWEEDPWLLPKPEVPQASSPALFTGGKHSLDTKLETSMKSFLQEIGNSTRYAELSKAAPAIFNFKTKYEESDSWSASIFQYNTQSWSLIDLDGIETNLKLIRAILN
jgi:hypothetical protein